MCDTSPSHLETCQQWLMRFCEILTATGSSSEGEGQQCQPSICPWDSQSCGTLPQAPAAGPACTRAVRARPQGWSSLPELSSVLLLGSAGFSPHKISVSSLLHCTALEPFACVCSYSLQGPSASFSSSCILSSTGHAPDKWPLLNAGFRGKFSKWQQVLGIPVSSEELFS